MRGYSVLVVKFIIVNEKTFVQLIKIGKKITYRKILCIEKHMQITKINIEKNYKQRIL